MLFEKKNIILILIKLYKLLMNLKLNYKIIIFFFNEIFQAFKIPESFPDYRHTALIMWLSLWGLYVLETLAGIIFHKEEKKVG